MKEIVGRKKSKNDTFPKNIIIDKIKMNNPKTIAKKFDEQGQILHLKFQKMVEVLNDLFL